MMMSFIYFWKTCISTEYTESESDVSRVRISRSALLTCSVGKYGKPATRMA